jgi:hypothetical protein
MKRDTPNAATLELPPDTSEVATDLLQPRQEFIAAQSVSGAVCFSDRE